MKPDFQTRFLSENYSILQGLKAVPIGVCLFLVSIWANLARYPVRDVSVPIALMLGAVLLAMAIQRYYQSAFGKVVPMHTHRQVYWILQGVWAFLALLAFWVDVTFRLPISLVGLVFVSMLLLDKPKVKLPLNEFSTTKLVSAICLTLVSLSPFVLGQDWLRIFGVKATILGITMLVGMLLAVQGIVWHVLLVRSLPASEAKDE